MTTVMEERKAERAARVNGRAKVEGRRVEGIAVAPVKEVPAKERTERDAASETSVRHVVTAPVVETPRRSWKKKAFIGAVLLAALAVGAKYGWSEWQWASVHETTDDAFIDGHVVQVSPRVGGHVLKVYVNDNQVVKAGDVLVELDPRDYQAALNQSQGKVTAAQADLVAAQSQVEQARAQIATAEAKVAQATAEQASRQAQFEQVSADLAQYTTAHNSGVVSSIEWSRVRTDVKTAQAALDAAKTAVTAAQADVTQAKATLAAREGQVAVSRAEITTAQAAVETATLNLSYTKVVASVDGRITKKNVEPGNYVVPAQVPALLGLVSNDVWVTANFKETQLAHMMAGQPVDVHVDAYPEVVFHGHVDSVQQGAGAYFSLLPPENATGNYVKVVQRVPVKVDLENVDGRYLLGPGMSVVPEVLVK